MSYTITSFPAPDDVTKRVPSNGVHLQIQNWKLCDVKVALRPFSTGFRLLTPNSFYALSVISTFVKSGDLYYLIDSFR